MSVLIPWMPEAIDVKVIASESQFQGYVPRGITYSVTYTPGEGVVVTVPLGPPGSHPFADGELHLKWIFQGANPSLPAKTARPVLPISAGAAANARLKARQIRSGRSSQV